MHLPCISQDRSEWLEQLLREEYGGGTITFDDEVIRENGIFIVDDLKGLNPDALKG